LARAIVINPVGEGGSSVDGDEPLARAMVMPKSTEAT
jgi:hypothetical protein